LSSLVVPMHVRTELRQPFHEGDIRVGDCHGDTYGSVFAVQDADRAFSIGWEQDA
jgi:hypothetical protein